MENINIKNEKYKFAVANLTHLFNNNTDKNNMKSKSFKLLLLTFLLSCYSIPAFSQTFKDALKWTPYRSLPYKRNKFSNDQGGCGIMNAKGLIPIKIYTNVQCTEYELADNYDTMPETNGLFKLTSSPHILMYIGMGGVTEAQTDELILVDAYGKVTDVLVSKVHVSGAIVKQFYINEDETIVVITLKPTTSASIPFSNFTQFTGYRIDETYKVMNGKFVLSKTQKYKERVYTYQQLVAKNYNLWDGNEQIVN